MRIDKQAEPSFSRHSTKLLIPQTSKLSSDDLPEVESRTQGSRPRPRPRTQKKLRGQGQGQGQPFRGQTLSRPRTGMLEAKAKDQGHKAQVLSKKKKKKKVFTKIFQAISKKKKKKGLHKNFFKRSPRKNALQKIFQPLHKILTFRKIVLSLEPRTGQFSRT